LLSYFRLWLWALGLPLLGLLQVHGFNPSDVSLTRGFEQQFAWPGQPVRVTATFTNRGTNTLQGFFYSEQVPTGATLATLQVTLNGQPIPNYLIESGTNGEVYADYTPQRWLLETPPFFFQSNRLPPGGTLQLLYTLRAPAPGLWRLPQSTWVGCDSLSTNALFGYSEPAEQLTLLVGGVPSARQYVTNGAFETWTTTNTFFGWTQTDPSKVTTNSAAISGQRSARVLTAARSSTEFQQPLDPQGQGTVAWLFEADFACSRPSAGSSRSFSLCLHHAPLPATNGINLRVVDTEGNGLGDLQVFNQPTASWLTVLSNAVTFSTNFSSRTSLYTNHLQILGRYHQSPPSYDLLLTNAWAAAAAALNLTNFQRAAPTNGNPVYALTFMPDTFTASSTAVVDNVSFVLAVPQLTLTPAATNVACGSAVTLSATAAGPGPFSYQWFDHQSNAIAGATGPTLSFTPQVSGHYSVVVSNLYGCVAASGALNVTDTTPPVIITRPAPQTVTAGYDGFATVPDLTVQLVARDACSPLVNLVQQPPAGTRWAVGTNQVVLAVDDGNGNTNTCTTTLAVVAPVFEAPVLLSPVRLPNGAFQFCFGGPAGQPYRLLATTDLSLPTAQWTVLTNGTFGSTAACYLESAAALPVRFYRVVSP
jgi:uncharacterized repeat protein (TIGR01451 family)